MESVRELVLGQPEDIKKYIIYWLKQAIREKVPTDFRSKPILLSSHFYLSFLKKVISICHIFQIFCKSKASSGLLIFFFPFIFDGFFQGTI